MKYKAKRRGPKQRHFTDLTDEQWAKIRPILLSALTRRYLRRVERSIWTLRDYADGLAYISRYRCKWRRIPREFPPAREVYQFNVFLRRRRLLPVLRKMLGEDVPFGLEAHYKTKARRGEYQHDRRIDLRKCDVCPRCGKNSMSCYGTKKQGSRIVRYYQCSSCRHKRVWVDVPQGCGWQGGLTEYASIAREQ